MVLNFEVNGIKCVVKWVKKKKTCWWFDHLKTKKNEKFMNKVYMNEIDSPRRRGRPVIRGKDSLRVLGEAGRL